MGDWHFAVHRGSASCNLGWRGKGEKTETGRVCMKMRLRSWVLDAAGLYGESVLYFRHGNGWKWVDGRIFCTGGGYADFLLLVSG